MALGPLSYSPDLTMAYTEVHVFKFADQIDLTFQCQISLCLVHDGGCRSLTPPNCPGQGSSSSTSHGPATSSLSTDNGPSYRANDAVGRPPAFEEPPVSPYPRYPGPRDLRRRPIGGPPPRAPLANSRPFLPPREAVAAQADAPPRRVHQKDQLIPLLLAEQGYFGLFL